MAVVYSEDLSNANSSSMISCLEELITSSSKMSEQINSFITASRDTLKGGGYDAVRTKLSVYADAFSKQSQICTILTGNAKSANNAMLNYMEGFTKLDNSLLEETKTELRNARETLQWLEDYSKVWVLDTETQKSVLKNRRNGSDYQIESYGLIIAEFEKLVEKLEHLASEDHGAYSILSSVSGDVNSYYNCVEGITTTTFTDI